MSGKQLPGWNGEVGVDFSDSPIAGTNCANCRSLLSTTAPLKCGSEQFVASKTPGKAAGEDEIPVRSGDPAKYCCNFWGMSEKAVRKKNGTAAWARRTAGR